MFQNILVPVDETPFAEEAIPWALAAAKRGAVLHIIHAHRFPPPEAMEVCDPTLDQALLIQEGRYLDELVTRARTVSPQIAFTTRNVDVCTIPAEAIASAARETRADLVVMATHGRGPLARFFFGSVSDLFTRLSPAPVLFVHSGMKNGKSDMTVHPRIEKLVVPLDGTEFGERVLGAAISLGAAFGCSYTLVYVPESDNDTTVGGAEAYLDRVGRFFPSSAVVSHKIARGYSPASAILMAAGNDPVIGVALTTHGRSGISRLLHGSVADEVIRKATGPVLVLHTSC